MRINPSIANQMYMNSLNSDSEDSTCLATGTYSNLAAAKYIKDNDANKDGTLTSDEVTISAEAFARLDADSDGKVTKDEMRESLAGQDDAIYQYYKNGGASSSTADLTSSLLESNASASNSGTYSSLAASNYLAANDANEDGVLSADEVSLSAEIFAKVDDNDDGKVTTAELKTALASKNTSIYSYYQNGGTDTISDLTSSLLAKI